MNEISRPLFVPNGHFYSPVTGADDVKSLRECVPAKKTIDLRPRAQLRNFMRLSKLGLEFPSSKTDGNFYYSDNDQFASGDSFVYSGMLRLANPKKIIEIGSGYSTAVLVDTLSYLSVEEISVIEPYPERLNMLLPGSDKIRIFQTNVQDVSIREFESLNAGDILFIDSSHVAKTNSDVLFELFEILPILKKGVFVHIHDMFWPFEYPSKWVQEDNRSWNELYFVRAFLSGNTSFSIEFFTDYFVKSNPKTWNENVPKSVINPGGGLWLRKRK